MPADAARPASGADAGAGRGTAARGLALDVLDRLEDAKAAPAERLFAQHPALASLTLRDRAFARTLYTTVLRRRGEIDAALTGFLAHPPKGVTLQNLLRLGCAQLTFLETPAHAAVSATVELAKRRAPRGAALVNGVLRRLASTTPPAPPPAERARLNTPGWLFESWRASFGEAAAEAIALAHQDEPPLDLTVKADPEVWGERLGAAAIIGRTVRLRHAGAIEALEGYDAGAWWVQDLAATLPALLLGDLRGREVLELCAAPGGKTAQMCSDGAKVVAVERSPERAALLRRNLDRLSLDAEIVAADALSWDDERRFQAILLDAPCSATGTIRRHPDILWARHPRDIPRHARLQARLLDAAIERLAPGGRLVYAVCSLEAKEGPDLVERALEQHPELRRAPVLREETGALALEPTSEGDLRCLPSMLPELGGMDGFFIARLEKAS